MWVRGNGAEGERAVWVRGTVRRGVRVVGEVKTARIWGQMGEKSGETARRGRARCGCGGTARIWGQMGAESGETARRGVRGVGAGNGADESARCGCGGTVRGGRRGGECAVWVRGDGVDLGANGSGERGKRRGWVRRGADRGVERVGEVLLGRREWRGKRE